MNNSKLLRKGSENIFGKLNMYRFRTFYGILKIILWRFLSYLHGHILGNLKSISKKTFFKEIILIDSLRFSINSVGGIKGFG